MTSDTNKPLSGKILDKSTDEIAKNSGGVLLHCCCAVCATSVIERLLPLTKLTLYYYNPNIQPREEYFKRLDALKTVANHYGLPLIYEPYDDSEFIAAVNGYEREPEGGGRCVKCFSLRLAASAQKATELNVPYYATTLTVSPHKSSEIINAIGYSYGSGDVKYLAADFKKRNGYLRSTQLSKELGLYRQDYCGCNYARREV